MRKLVVTGPQPAALGEADFARKGPGHGLAGRGGIVVIDPTYSVGEDAYAALTAGPPRS